VLFKISKQVFVVIIIVIIFIIRLSIL